MSGVSFDVERGEILCLVGESGSGKSVIAQAIMGLLPKTLPVDRRQHPARRRGPDARGARARLRELRGARMSMIFQEPMTALNPVMRCGEQIDEVLRVHTALAARRAPREDPRLCCARCALPDPGAHRSRRIRTSSPAASASAS